MKTLVIYEFIPEYSHVFLAEGDHSELNGFLINQADPIPEEIEKKLTAIACFLNPKDAGDLEEQAKFWQSREVKTPIKTDQDTIVVKCGFLM